MQFHNKNNERVPQELKKNYMSSSQFFPCYQYNENQNSSIVQPIHSPTQKTELKQSAEKPAFLQNRKNNNIYRSMMFNLPETQSPSKFQNPFLGSKEIRGSVQEPSTKTIERQNMKQSFIPQQQLQNIENKITPRKFYSPKPMKFKQPNFLIKSVDELSNANKPKECISKQVFSPIHPKRIIDFQAQSPGVASLNKVFSDRKKEKELKSDEKTTLPLSQKSTKVPQFLKKNSPQNQSVKIPQIEPTKSSEGQIKLQKVSSQFGTQAPSNASMKKSMINSKFSGFKNYVQTQSFFSKKKQPQFSSSSFAKISNTPQNNPMKSEQTNFQFGRLSSPSALNHRRRIDSVHSKQITLSCFQLVDKIGKGAFGDVFIARQKLTGFLCVLKKVSKKKIKELKLQESIIRQIKIQSYLHHKHLTALYGFFADSEYLYLILEILPDGSMSQVKKNKKVPEVQVSRYLRQVCQGLRYMHKQEVIHRDLKPQNIFLYEDYLKIGDFGCAIYTQTLRKTVVGCLAYSSPEQLKNSLYDDKIDAWSVGILTYELLTGKSPFDNDLSKVFNNQMQLKDLKLQFPQGLNISETCKDFLLKLLALNPQERMSIDQTTKHPFITQLLKQDRKQELQVFSTYQSL